MLAISLSLFVDHPKHIVVCVCVCVCVCVSVCVSKTSGPSPIATADSDIMHHQFRLSLLQWNPGPARRNPTNIVSAACGKFHAVILQEASDHAPHISDYFRAYTDNTEQGHLRARPFCHLVQG